jgi:hypothetical protein
MFLLLEFHNLTLLLAAIFTLSLCLQITGHFKDFFLSSFQSIQKNVQNTFHKMKATHTFVFKQTTFFLSFHNELFFFFFTFNFFSEMLFAKNVFPPFLLSGVYPIVVLLSLRKCRKSKISTAIQKSSSSLTDKCIFNIINWKFFRFNMSRQKANKTLNTLQYQKSRHYNLNDKSQGSL